MNMDQKLEDLRFTAGWTARLLRELEKTRVSEDAASFPQVMRGCSDYCFRTNNFEEQLKGIDTMTAFAEFCRTRLGWRVDFDAAAETMLCDEQKDACLCPVSRVEKMPGVLCCCTQGQIARMVQFALNRPADVEIVHAYLRDGQSCQYRITFR